MNQNTTFICSKCGAMLIRNKSYMAILKAKNDANRINKKPVVVDVCIECNYSVGEEY